VIGPGNHFHTGCVIGDAPQDLKYRGASTRVRIGEQNVFREHVTVHRSANLTEDTLIGSHNFFMAHSHVGHNTQVGNPVILANGALLGGHARIGDRAFISGNCLVHQFTRVGTLALMQGGSAVSKDLPPFTIVRGANRLCGLNIVGLRRAGMSSAERLELKALYHALFRSGEPLRLAARNAAQEFSGSAALVMMQFITSSKRGVCADPGRKSRTGSREEPVAADLQNETA
jgi:UDP-N-acetylglucosamine acyltransferase